MPEIKIIKQITQTENGPAVTDTVEIGNPQYIHMQQGSLDGACGPYCLCMALVALGFEKFSKLTNRSDSQTSQRLFEIIAENSLALVRDGMYLNTLVKAAKVYDEKGLQYKKISAALHGNSTAAKEENKKFDHTRVKEFVIEHILKDHVVILASRHHWVMVIGLEYENNIHTDVAPRLFLVLDPDEAPPKYAAWNGVIDISVKGKGNLWFGSGSFALYDAIALWI